MQLAHRDDIQLLALHIADGIANAPAHPALTEQQLAWYTQCNGAQLVWIRKDNPDFDPAQHTLSPHPLPWLQLWQADYPYDGAVMLLPFEVTFGENWENRVWFQQEALYTTTYLGRTLSMLDFKRHIHPFDAFSKYYTVSICTLDESRPGTLLLGQDYGADYTSSKRLDWETYLNLIIDTQGNIQARVSAMKDTWGALD